MYKCPYCGHENEDLHCRKCSAMIPGETAEEKTPDKPAETKVDEPTRVYRKRTRSE